MQVYADVRNKIAARNHEEKRLAVIQPSEACIDAATTSTLVYLSFTF